MFYNRSLQYFLLYLKNAYSSHNKKLLNGNLICNQLIKSCSWILLWWCSRVPHLSLYCSSFWQEYLHIYTLESLESLYNNIIYYIGSLIYALSVYPVYYLIYERWVPYINSNCRVGVYRVTYTRDQLISKY